MTECTLIGSLNKGTNQKMETNLKLAPSETENLEPPETSMRSINSQLAPITVKNTSMVQKHSYNLRVMKPGPRVWVDMC